LTRSNAAQFASKRDFWLCLARAFAPPGGEEFRQSFVEALPEDLDAIAYEIDLDISVDIGAFTADAHQLTDGLEIQRLYASLFSVPPAPVHVNTAIYLDGAFLGESELEIHQWYARHGFERHEAFHDLNDHVAVQLEFVGLLYGKASERAAQGEDLDGQALATEAERFIHAYPRRWIGPFLKTLQQACAARGLNTAYLQLARMLWRGIEHELAHGTRRFELEADAPLPIGSARGIGPPSAEDLAEIAVRLTAAGLGIEHIRQQPGWSEEAFERCRASERPAGLRQ
jgi:TorA maturation chaperone TorD